MYVLALAIGVDHCTPVADPGASLSPFAELIEVRLINEDDCPSFCFIPDDVLDVLYPLLNVDEEVHAFGDLVDKLEGEASAV